MSHQLRQTSAKSISFYSKILIGWLMHSDAALLCKIGALRSFSLEKLQYWRERVSGMSSLAYFLSKDTIDHFNTAIKPIIYLSMFYFVNNPRSSIAANYTILVALVYCVTGIGYIFAICFQPGSAQLVCPRSYLKLFFSIISFLFSLSLTPS